MKFGKLFSAITNIVTLPVSTAIDIITLGNGTETKNKLKKIEKDLDQITE
ncbi:hypothetical protein KAZ57_00430 [Patescibacteria group bacterium]|nr:hypothetical protein [Patescibacteria group bacterium]